MPSNDKRQILRYNLKSENPLRATNDNNGNNSLELTAYSLTTGTTEAWMHGNDKKIKKL